MSWTNDQPIRIVSAYPPHVAKPHIPSGGWQCDSCAPANRRFRVNWGGQDIEMPWWGVITSNDDAKTRYLKWTAARNARRLDEAMRQIQSLARDAEMGYRETESAIMRIAEVAATA